MSVEELLQSTRVPLDQGDPPRRQATLTDCVKTRNTGRALGQMRYLLLSHASLPGHKPPLAVS